MEILRDLARAFLFSVGGMSVLTAVLMYAALFRRRP